MSTLCNCLQIPANVAYCMNTKCDSILWYFITATNPQLRIVAILMLSYLEKKLTMEQISIYSKIKPSDVTTIEALLIESNYSQDSYWSTVSLLKALQAFLTLYSDPIVVFLQEGILSTLFDLLSTDKYTLLVQVLTTIWTIGIHNSAVIRSQHDFLCRLKSLQASEDDDVTLVAMCALWDIFGPEGIVYCMDLIFDLF